MVLSSFSLAQVNSQQLSTVFTIFGNGAWKSLNVTTVFKHGSGLQHVFHVKINKSIAMNDTGKYEPG